MPRVGPAYSGEGKETRREPRVQHVLVLQHCQLLPRKPGRGLCQRILLRLGDHPALKLLVLGHQTLLALENGVEGRDAVSPPQLARNAPVADVAEPVMPLPLVLCRQDREAPIFDTLQSVRRHLLAVDPPLRLQHRLDNVLGARRHAQPHAGVGLGAFEEPLLSQLLDDLKPGLEAVHIVVLFAARCVERAVVVEDVDEFELVLLTRHKIVGVVRGRHLDSARSKVHVDQLRVQDDGHLPARHRVDEHFAVERRVARVVGVHGHGRVAKHGLGTRRRNHNLLPGALHLIGPLPKHAKVHLAVVARHHDLVGPLKCNVVHLQVRHRRLELRIPVDQTLRTVDELLLVHAQERLLDRLAQVLVHSEAIAAPVQRRPEPPQLVVDDPARHLFPLPHLLDKLLAPQIVPRHPPLLHELLLHHHLRRNACVVRPWQPQHIVALHAAPACNRVLDRTRQRMPNVQRACHVGRRQHHDKLLLCRVLVGPVEPRLRPPLVPRRLHVLGRIRVEHRHRHVLLLARRENHLRHHLHHLLHLDLLLLRLFRVLGRLRIRRRLGRLLRRELGSLFVALALLLAALGRAPRRSVHHHGPPQPVARPAVLDAEHLCLLWGGLLWL
mmetsp:Transcript_61166/g.98962  ORF Transcript_61166/g.98962 Transcript_61166/m.98962 type:complete len:611 (-) Transcript_61166:740-2572(-)